MNDRSPALAAAAELVMIRLYAEPSPAEAQTETHVFSPEFERAMARLIRHVRGGRYHTLTRAAKVALIAAVLAALLAGSALAAERYGFSLTRFWDHAEVNIEKHHEELKEDLTVGYVPEGFVLVEEIKKPTMHSLVYESIDSSNQNFIIDKYSTYSVLGIDNENREIHEIILNDVTYTISKDENSIYVLWMYSDNPCLYSFIAHNMEESEAFVIIEKIQ